MKCLHHAIGLTPLISVICWKKSQKKRMFKTFPKTVFLAFILVVGLANATAYGQYKKIYSIDRPDLMEPNLFSATKVLETNLPGRRIAISGTLNVQDTSFFTYQSIYDLLTDLHGNPTGMHLYEDTSSFLFQGPRGYSACYDGNGHFYHAIGSNNRQVVMKTDTAGNVLWANTQNHHEFYSIVCENSGVVYLGQDESIQGAHDFSLARIDENGTASQGNMFGTIDFEQPYKVIRDGNHYVMAGSSFKQTGFYLMIVKADMNFQTVWGRVTRSPGKDMNCTAVASAADGSGYIFSGRARGGADSVFVMKTDTAGNTVWMKLFNIGGATEAHN